MKSLRRLDDDRGIALAVVLLILVIVLLLGTTLIGVSVTEDRAGSIRADMKKAFSAAETGIQEAMYRMRLDPATVPDEGDTACSATADPVLVGPQGTPDPSWADPTKVAFWKYNPPACSWTYAGSSAAGYGNYLGGTPANLDSAGRTFTSSGGSHAAGGLLVNANITNGASYTVTVTPVVGFVGGCWQYVDQSGAPLGSCDSVAPNPLFKVTSTGTERSTRKTLSTMIQRFNINPKLDGTLTANTNIDVKSASAVIDGRNSDCEGNNPSNTGSMQAATAPSGASGVDINKPENLVCGAGTGDACKGTSSPFPSTLGALLLGPTANTKDINALNAYLETIKVTPKNAPDSKDPPYHGILYVNGDYKEPPGDSTGILIVHEVDKDGKYNAKLGPWSKGSFKGLVIADRIYKIDGNVQITGGILGIGSAADGVKVDDIAGTPDIKYSKCIIDGLSHNFPFRNVPGTWHEQSPAYP